MKSRRARRARQLNAETRFLFYVRRLPESSQRKFLTYIQYNTGVKPRRVFYIVDPTGGKRRL